MLSVACRAPFGSHGMSVTRAASFGRMRSVTVRQLLSHTSGIGPMWTVFFGVDRVQRAEDASASDTAMFGRWFRAMLQRGVYLAPSAYEAGFLSTAHEGAAIARACEVLTTAVREI